MSVRLVRMRENTDQKSSEYGQFSRSACLKDMYKVLKQIGRIRLLSELTNLLNLLKLLNFARVFTSKKDLKDQNLNIISRVRKLILG